MPVEQKLPHFTHFPRALSAPARRPDSLAAHLGSSPKCNAFAERFVRECRETLDNLILIGQPHLEHVLKKIERHHNRHRPHQGIGNGIPLGYDYPDSPAPPGKVKCEQSPGGLLNHYFVDKAA